MSNREVVDAIRRILITGGNGSNATADALNAAGIKISPYGARPDLPAARGQGNNAPQSTSGIASPLTEGIDEATGAPAREYYDTQLKTSADGLFTLPIKPIKTLNFTDAKGNQVVVQLVKPSVPTT